MEILPYESPNSNLILYFAEKKFPISPPLSFIGSIQVEFIEPRKVGFIIICWEYISRLIHLPYFFISSAKLTGITLFQFLQQGAARIPHATWIL